MRRHRLFDDASFLRVIDLGEQQLAKVLAAALFLVILVASIQLVAQWLVGLSTGGTSWYGNRLIQLLGDLLSLLIGLEVLQNITAYLRRRVVQVELVLVTAITAVSRKVIVLPPGSENKPQLLLGLGVAVLSLAGAYWFVLKATTVRHPARTGPATPNPERDRWPAGDDADGP